MPCTRTRRQYLVETGTRALIGAVFGPPATGEADYARQLLPLLRPDMLVLADRGFDAATFVAEVAATRAAFLCGCAPAAGCRCWPGCRTARSCPGSAS